jgi:hypothetical protein
MAHTVSKGDVIKWKQKQSPIISLDALFNGTCHHIHHLMAVVSQRALRSAGRAGCQKHAGDVITGNRNLRFDFATSGYQVIVWAATFQITMDANRVLDAFRAGQNGLDDTAEIRIKKMALPLIEWVAFIGLFLQDKDPVRPGGSKLHWQTALCCETPCFEL